MGYRLSQQAESDIIHLYLEGAAQFGALQAEKYHTGLERLFEFLSDHPKAAREREEITPPVRVHRYEAHLVIYIIEESGDIVILRVRHGREDWNSDPV